MQAHYPEGSYTFTHSPEGGLSFYAPGPDEVDLTTAKEATFGYSVMFEEGFEWQKGGKLPGLCECLVAVLSYPVAFLFCALSLVLVLEHHFWIARVHWCRLECAGIDMWLPTLQRVSHEHKPLRFSSDY